MEDTISTQNEAQATSPQTNSNEVVPNLASSDAPQSLEPRNNVEILLKEQGKVDVFDLIKTFKGKIFTKQNKQYFENIQQYASASIAPSLIQPFFLTYPQSIQDITIMLKAAHLLNKKVVARSGGHQYCGLSLGGSNTIVLSMNNFNTAKLNQDGIIEVEPCVPLIQFSKKQKQWGLFLPHGRCPLVNVGGHAQTGGYGPFLRSFGIFLDYIIGFEIVLANGQFKRVNRPLPNAVISNEKERFNLQLFRGVLGGNAGSFGIVTKFYIKAVKDVDHPQSYGFSYARLYNKDLMLQVLKVLKKWTQIIAEGESDQSLKGCNIQVATSEIELEPTKQKAHAIFVSGVYGDTDKGVPYNNQFKEILDALKKGQTQQQKELNVALQSWQGKYPLSELAARNVFSQETQLGTNISLPYHKRCNITMSALTENFINEYNQFTSKAIHSVGSATHIDTFMMIAGGAHKENGKPTVDGLTITSIPQRNCIHNFMLDICFDLTLDPLAGEKAEQIQSQMGKIVDEHYNTPGIGTKKFFAGSFGDLDMTKPEVINAYYDSVEQYAQLQKLKEKVDPHDIFHTVMTVKLPTK